MRNEIEKLFSQEMTRKEFLQYVGSAFLLAIGLGGILKALHHSPKQSRGYGVSSYGGH